MVLAFITAVNLLLTLTPAPIARAAAFPKCAPATPTRRLRDSAAVFVGRVLVVRESGTTQEVKLGVIKRWKGAAAAEVSITNAVHPEGVYFREGESYLVYAAWRGSRLRTGGCSGTVGVEQGWEDIEALDGQAGGQRPAGGG